MKMKSLQLSGCFIAAALSPPALALTINDLVTLAYVQCWLKGRAGLVASVVLALAPWGYSQAPMTNNLSSGTNRVAPIASVGGNTPFAGAVVDHAGVKLPEQGPWTISDSDFQQPYGVTQDLVQHIDPMFLFLWNLLSSETRSSLEKEWASIVPFTAYKPGAGIGDLAADLNRLIQGKLIYDEQTFAQIKPYFSGDTVKLLNQPAGADVARLNRLLLEEAFPLDIRRRPKILFDPDSRNYVFVDFAAKTVSLFGEDGNKKWTADVGPGIASQSRAFPSFRNPGIPASHNNLGLWDVSPRQGWLLMWVGGNAHCRIDLNTGVVVALPRL